MEVMAPDVRQQSDKRQHLLFFVPGPQALLLNNIFPAGLDVVGAKNTDLW